MRLINSTDTVILSVNSGVTTLGKIKRSEIGTRRAIKLSEGVYRFIANHELPQPGEVRIWNIGLYIVVALDKNYITFNESIPVKRHSAAFNGERPFFNISPDQFDAMSGKQKAEFTKNAFNPRDVYLMIFRVCTKKPSMRKTFQLEQLLLLVRPR